MLAADVLISGIKLLGQTAVGAFSSIADKSVELEKINTQFEVLTGSVENAQVLLSDLQQFAATTPFQLPGLANAASQLLSFGFAQEEVIDRLKVLGDIAAGSGSDIKEITLIFGQVAAAGKLTGERLLQLQERAIPIGPAIAETLGVAESAVRGLVSEGKVQFADFARAFESLTVEGGKFFQATIKQSKTLGGVLSTLSDNFDLLQTDIGQAVLPAFKEFGIELINIIQQNREFIKSISGAALRSFGQAIVDLIKNVASFTEFVRENRTTIVAFASVLGTATLAATGLSIAVKLLGAAQVQASAASAAQATSNIFLSTSYAAASKASIATTAAFVAQAAATKLATAATTALNFVLNLNPLVLFGTLLAAASVALIKFSESSAVARGKIAVFAADIIDKTVPAIRFLLESVGSFVGVFDKELGQSIQNSITRIEKFTESLRKSGEASIRSAELQKLSLEEEAAKVEEVEARKREAKRQTAQQEKQTIDELRTLREQVKLEESIAEEQKKLLNEENRSERFLQLQEQLGTEEAIKTEARARALEADKKGGQAELEIRKRLAKDNQKIRRNELKFIDLTAKEQVRAAGETANLLVGLAEASGKKAGSFGKAAASAQAVIQGILAVQRTYASSPFPLNIANAAIIAAITAANVRRINSAPAFQDGGIVPGNQFSGDNVLARVNSGELILNRAQQGNIASNLVSAESAQEQILNELQKLNNQTISLQVDGREIARTIRDQDRAGFAFA